LSDQKNYVGAINLSACSGGILEVDYYYLLGIPENATSKEVKIAYRKMAEVYHPDKLRELPEDSRREGEEIMRLLNDAKSILLNPERREEYDNRIGVGLELQEAMIVEPSRADEFMVAIEKETLATKMSGVLDSMKEVFKNNRDFQNKIAVAEEVVVAQIVDDDSLRASVKTKEKKKEEENEIEMKLSFEVVDKDAPSSPETGDKKKKFRIIAIEGDDTDVSSDDEVDVEWD
jgi:curved DNA-binding protein CbpA